MSEKYYDCNEYASLLEAIRNDNNIRLIELVSGCYDVNSKPIGDFKDNEDGGLLHFACREKKEWAVEILLNAGIGIYARDSNGKFAIQYCENKSKIKNLIVARFREIMKNLGMGHVCE